MHDTQLNGGSGSADEKELKLAQFATGSLDAIHDRGHEVLDDCLFGLLLLRTLGEPNIGLLMVSSEGMERDEVKKMLENAYEAFLKNPQGEQVPRRE